MRKSRLVGAVVLVLTLLFACTPAGGGDEKPSDVLVALPADNPGDIELRNRLAKQFMKDNPGIDVKVQVIPSNGYNEKIFTTVAAGNPPDIFNSGDIVIPTIVSKNYALDLTELIEKDDYDVSAFYPQVIEGLTFENKIVGLTDNWDTQVMYYNRDLFDKAGLDYPDATWTWDDFESAARALTSGEGPDKIFGAVHGYWFAPVFDQIWANGGDIFSKDQTECLLDQPEAVEAIQSISDLAQEGVIPTEQQLEGQGPNQFLLAGRAAMAVDAGRWAAFELLDGKVDWAAAPIPKGSEGRANFFHLSMYAITRTSDSPENAWEFLKYMVSPEAIKLAVEDMQGIPSRPGLATSPAFRNNALVKQHDALEPFLESLPTAHKAPYVPNFEEYNNTIDGGLDPVWTGEETAAEATSKICERVEEQIAENAK